MSKLLELTPEYVEYMPDTLKSGQLYISKRFKLATHLCACGCGELTTTPIGENGGWTLLEKDNKVTLKPSIGNFSGETPYHAHYYITDNKIHWL